MTNINILYDGQYDDVDIISIPSNMIGCIDKLAQEYLDWTPPDDDVDNWVIINNKRCMSKGSLGFVNWLNSMYCVNEKASIVSENVSFCPSYSTIEF